MTCRRCGADISHRWANAKRCDACAAVQGRTKRNDRRRQRYATDPVFRQYHLDYQRAHREEEATRRRERYARDPVYREAEKLRGRARTPWDASVTPEAITRLYHRLGGKCPTPGCMTDLAKGFHLDHILPLSDGGPSTLSNLTLLCPPCNRAKGAKRLQLV